MKKPLLAMMLTNVLTACLDNVEIAAIGGQKDAHGCLTASGQRYSFLKQACIQPFDVADIKLADPQNKSLAIYVILSEDRSQAEILASELPENTILDVVKGGYISKDNKIRLLKTAGHWKLQKYD
ncbi:hypothetical protein A4G16_07595 [Mannheimia granulomatis]|uniref:Lipoprotein n=1 Tax=Mannheimia granulomatis TaxID=85402 RepID=A0A6G8JK54_9PAST|nr:hypothetical protein [Mannheimia granulomatis]QIM67238.1 hypothetical protein A4G16_07595 [Mannheimia granulomatis]